MRFISRLDSEGKSHLRQYLSDNSLLERERVRFTMVMLSSEHLMPISEIAATCGVSENTVKKWFDRYEREGFEGLLDRNMAHKKSVLDSVDSALILSCVEAHPQDLTQAVAQLSATSGLVVSEWILRNYLKKKVDI
jgi:transposase